MASWALGAALLCLGGALVGPELLPPAHRDGPVLAHGQASTRGPEARTPDEDPLFAKGSIRGLGGPASWDGRGAQRLPPGPTPNIQCWGSGALLGDLFRTQSGSTQPGNRQGGHRRRLLTHGSFSLFYAPD